MKFKKLGRTEISVSEVCLGSMTWGEQNSLEEGFEQMDYALEQGVNFIDTAEMYAVPARKKTYGRSEEIIGEWLSARGTRDKIVLATKVVGPGERFGYIRDGKPRLNKTHMVAALDKSLQRLKTDYIDLYQLHWSERPVNRFGNLGYRPSAVDDGTPLEETLSVLEEFVKAGKVRSVGLSNETAWGTMSFLALAEQGKGPRMASIQNPYSLLNRSFEVGLAEVALREDCGLLAYAPVAAGALSGKYIGGERPEGARMTLFPENKRYFTKSGLAATEKYAALAREAGMDPASMAHAFVYSRPFLTSSIVGATKMDQLKVAIAAKDLVLGEDLLSKIEEIHAEHTYPCP